MSSEGVTFAQLRASRAAQSAARTSTVLHKAVSESVGESLKGMSNATQGAVEEALRAIIPEIVRSVEAVQQSLPDDRTDEILEQVRNIRPEASQVELPDIAAIVKEAVGGINIQVPEPEAPVAYEKTYEVEVMEFDIRNRPSSVKIIERGTPSEES